MRSVPAIAITTVFFLAACAPREAPPLQGYVEGEYVRVAAPFGGTLVKLAVHRGDAVAEGAPLFALESANEDAGRREAQEQARRAQAQLDDLRKGRRPTEIDAVRAQLAQAQSAATLSEKELARQLDLVARGFVSAQSADQARASRDRDRDRVAEVRNQLATAQAGARPDEIRAAEAQLAAAREALAQAEWRLQQKTVAATATGLVTDTLFVQGEWVNAGTPVVALLPPTNVKVRFFVPEPKLGAVKVGGRVRIACDACGAPIEAAITYISPQAEYTPPVVYSKDARAKMVFLVEARPALSEAARLHPGQPVDVTLP